MQSSNMIWLERNWNLNKNESGNKKRKKKTTGTNYVGKEKDPQEKKLENCFIVTQIDQMPSGTKH